MAARKSQTRRWRAAGEADIRSWRDRHNPSTISETVSTQDADWFRAHPEAGCYIRPLVPGEFGSFPVGRCRHALVTSIAEGIRHRTPLRLFTDSDALITELVIAETGERWDVDADGALHPRPGTNREPWEALCGVESQRLIEHGRAMGGRS